MQSDKKLMFLDIETTGLVPKGANYKTDFIEFPYLVQLSWIVQDSLGEIEKDFIIYPEFWTISEEVSMIHGITQERAEDEGVLFPDVLKELANDATGAEKIVGHNLYFDTSIIKANVLKFSLTEFLEEILNPALDKSKRIDTMMKTIKFCGLKQEGSNRPKFPSLVDLHFKIFGEGFEAHNSLEDCRAMSRCFPELLKLGLIEL